MKAYGLICAAQKLSGKLIACATLRMVRKNRIIFAFLELKVLLIHPLRVGFGAIVSPTTVDLARVALTHAHIDRINTAHSSITLSATLQTLAC